jgi:hypothetical protein
MIFEALARVLQSVSNWLGRKDAHHFSISSTPENLCLAKTLSVVLSDAFTFVRLIFCFWGARDCLTPEPPALDPISERRATTQTGQCT